MAGNAERTSCRTRAGIRSVRKPSWLLCVNDVMSYTIAVGSRSQLNRSVQNRSVQYRTQQGLASLRILLVVGAADLRAHVGLRTLRVGTERPVGGIVIPQRSTRLLPVIAAVGYITFQGVSHCCIPGCRLRCAATSSRTVLHFYFLLQLHVGAQNCGPVEGRQGRTSPKRCAAMSIAGLRGWF